MYYKSYNNYIKEQIKQQKSMKAYYSASLINNILEQNREFRKFAR